MEPQVKRPFQFDDDTDSQGAKPRQRRKRTFFTNEQLDRMEEIFQQERFPGIVTREALTEELKIKEDRIQVWFQNRRARWRKRETKTKPAPSDAPADDVTSTQPWRGAIHGFPESSLCYPPFLNYMSATESKSSQYESESAFIFPPLLYASAAFQFPPFSTNPDITNSAKDDQHHLSPMQAHCHTSSPTTSSRSPSPCHNNSTESRSSLPGSDTFSCHAGNYRLPVFCRPYPVTNSKAHSVDEYVAAAGLLSVIERQN